MTQTNPRTILEMETNALTTPEAVRAVIANADPIVRNLQITQSYHELSAALNERYGGVDVAWTAHATWASKQAGTFIRNEEVPAPLRRFLAGGRGAWWRPSTWLRRHRLLEYARATVADVAANIAAGNHQVYTRLARIFADYLSLARELGGPDPARLDALLDAVVERDPSVDEPLRRAFVHYHAALFEGDARKRAELVFLANALVGWHEQIRLQEAIDGALSAPIRRALDDPERRWTRWPLPGWLRRLGAAAFRTVFAPAIRHFEREWKQVATECLMTLGLPSGRLELGDDVPPLPDGRMFPAALERIEHPEALELLARFDATPDTTRGSGARDWTMLEDRMNYIVDLFRSRQQEAEMLAPPFTPEQAAAIRVGRLPGGRL